MVSSWFHRQEVRSRSDGDLLLEAAGAIPSAHEHKRIIGVWLQLCDQLPLQVALNLHTLLVVQNLQQDGVTEVHLHRAVIMITVTSVITAHQPVSCLHERALSLP